MAQCCYGLSFFYLGGNREREQKVAGKVTGLQLQKRNKDRVNVYIDGQFAFGLTAVDAAGLHKGQYLSDEQIASLQKEDYRQKAFDRAVRFLSYRPRSQTEVIRYLKQKLLDDDTLDYVIDRLQQYDYLNDVAFARFWVENRQRFKPRSKRALNYELREKGVEREVADAVIEDVDEEEAAWQAIATKLDSWSHLEREAFRKKLFGFLQRRGFSYDVIKHTLLKACQMTNNDD